MRTNASMQFVSFIGARLVVDVLFPRIVLVLVINSWFNLNGYSIFLLSGDGKFFKVSSGLPMWSVDAVNRHHHLLDDAARTLASHTTCLLSAKVCPCRNCHALAFQEGRPFFLWVISFLRILFIGVLEGIAIAVILALGVVIFESARPQMVVLWQIPGTSIYCNMKQENSGAFVPNVLLVRIGASMYFANSTYIKDTLKQFVKDLREVNPVEYLVLGMTSVVSVDTTVLTVIKDMDEICTLCGWTTIMRSTGTTSSQ